MKTPDLADFYWGIFAALAGAVWVFIVFIRDRNAASTERSSDLVKRLHELDHAVMEHPDIQKYLSLTATKDESHFRTAGVLQDSTFYKAKALAYGYLNLFDEILSISSRSKSGFALLAPQVIELSDWENYIKLKFQHPLYQSILNHESPIFGAALRHFWSSHKSSVTSTPADPYTW